MALNLLYGMVVFYVPMNGVIMVGRIIVGKLNKRNGRKPTRLVKQVILEVGSSVLSVGRGKAI